MTVQSKVLAVSRAVAVWENHLSIGVGWAESDIWVVCCGNIPC
jgi:hypothetical protein